MSVLTAILAGGLIGWTGSLCMRTETNAGILTDILAGLVGALIAPILIATSTIMDTLLAAALGAAVLVCLIGLVRSTLQGKDAAG